MSPVVVVLAPVLAFSALAGSSADRTGELLIACAPTAYEQALGCLDRYLDPLTKSDLMKTDGVIEAHFGLGLFIRNHWGLWKRGEFAVSMETLGFRHPDDMSAAILKGYASRLRGEAYDLDGAAREYAAYWSEVEKTQKTMQQACDPRTPVAAGNGRVAACEWHPDMKQNVMHFEKQED